MEFTQSINKCFKHFSDFEGRASRSEFWWFFLFSCIVSIVAVFLDELFGSWITPEWGMFDVMSTIILMLPQLAVGSRRLHDLGRSGWWQLLYLTIIGIVLLIIWFATDGAKKNNQFGKPIKIKK